MSTLLPGTAAATVSPSGPGGAAAPDRTALVPLLAVASGVAVADANYLPPLLAVMSRDLGVGVGALGGVAALAMLGYALGLLLVVPLGDVVDRRLLATTVLSGTVVSLAAVALAPTVPLLALAALGVGLTSVVAQVLVPYAASLADDASRGRVVGTVFGGILTGIVGARVVSGLAAGPVGWRGVYAGAAVLTLGLLVLLRVRLPREPQRHRRNGRADVPYRQVLAGVVHLARTSRALQVRSVYGACGFGVFSAVWTTLAFHLRDAYGLGPQAVAGVALLGAVGAWASPRFGRLADRGHAVAMTGTGYAVLLLSTAVLAAGADSFALLLLGLVLMDLGVQAGHTASLGVVYKLVAPAERSRATTVYMTSVFVGGATGSALAAAAYGARGWSGTAGVCGLLAVVAVGLWVARLRVHAPVTLDEAWPDSVA